MAEKSRSSVRGQSQEQAKPPLPKKPVPAPQKRSIILRTLMILFLLLGILGTGFAAGVYLNIIDMQKLAHTYKLHEYPVLNKYFPQPQTNFETVPLEEGESNAVKQAAEPAPSAPPASAQMPSPDIKETNAAELEKLIKARQQEEAKKVTRLARLYGTMKPEEAVAILNKLDDDTVLAIFNRMEDEQVAKILALLDANRAARITQDMLKVKPVSTPIPRT